MKRAYPTFIAMCGQDSLVYVPDMAIYTSGILTMVDVDFSEYRRRNDNRMVRRNVTLPNWLNAEAERLHLNVSRVLQEALADRVERMR